MLEEVRDATKLAEAERWWIAFGEACGWPLTNVTAGGYPSEAVILERQRRRAAEEAAEGARVRSFYSPEEVDACRRYLKKHYGIPAEIERRCIQFFAESASKDAAHEDALINAVIAKVRVTRETATQLYAQWWSAQNPAMAANQAAVPQTAELQSLCFRLFEKLIGSDGLIADVAVEAGVPYKTAAHLYKKWLQVSMQRGRRALDEDRTRLFTRLRGDELEGIIASEET